jgi:hypothetical protein
MAVPTIVMHGMVIHVELRKIKVRALPVVVLKGSNRVCDDLRLGITRRLILLNNMDLR